MAIRAARVVLMEVVMDGSEPAREPEALEPRSSSRSRRIARSVSKRVWSLLLCLVTVLAMPFIALAVLLATILIFLVGVAFVVVGVSLIPAVLGWGLFAFGIGIWL